MHTGGDGCDTTGLPPLEPPIPPRAPGAALRFLVQTRQGSTQMTSLPPNTPPRQLGLVIDLDICVGCHACAVNCKEWNTGGHMAPLTDLNAYGAKPSGVWFNRIHTFEVEGE